MKIVRKPLSELRKMEKNVRMHTEKQIAEYARSVEMFDQIRPIVCDETGLIIAGNGLYDALVKLGRDSADCYVVAGLTEAQKKKLMLADNKVYELGITDTNMFQEILKDLDMDFDIPGYDASMLEMITMSMPEVDDFVGGYGAFEPQQVDRINSKTAEPHTAGPAAPLPVASDPAPIYEPSQSGTPPDGPSAVVHEDTAGDTPPGRFVICPKCGEKICL